MSGSDRVEVPGSHRSPVSGHRRVADVDLSEELEVTLYLRPRPSAEGGGERLAAGGGRTAAADDRTEAAPAKPLSRERWRERNGADPDDVDAVKRFAADHALQVTAVDHARRSVVVRGTLRAIAEAFEAQLHGRFDPGGGRPSYRGRSGPLTVPADLADVVAGVFGIDDRPQAAVQLRRIVATPAAGSVSYTPVQVAQAYRFPTGVDGSGETVGIIELGGGFQTTDLTTYFQGLGLSVPSVTSVSVDGGANKPGADQNADGEVMLDIEVVGAVANGVKIAVYFAPNTDQGFIDAVTTAVHDKTNRPSVISISWGGPEESWTAQARTQLEQAMTDAGTLGVTVTVAAGDNGSTDGQSDGKQHVDFPASAPHALACGGTALTASGGSISSEVVWSTTNDGTTGGGISTAFAAPSYQSEAKLPDNADTGKPGRGVPDVSGDADPQTGYQVLVDGQRQVIGGTSAVAPLWAGLVALLNQSLGTPLGFAQPRLYPLLGSPAFRDITSGSNGAYTAAAGWDACTGLGSPDGSQLASQLARGSAG